MLTRIAGDAAVSVSLGRILIRFNDFVSESLKLSPLGILMGTMIPSRHAR